MKVRIKFRKQGNMKFIGHLDIMRYFQKVMRRADVDIRYSEGFSPHQIMSFAAPLGVGLTSNGEYMDIEIKSPIASADAVRQLNEVMVEGMEVLSFRQIEEGKAGKAMSLVAAADYTVSFRPGYEPKEGWQERLEAFAKKDSIVILKKTKKSEVETDIRPMIYQLSVDGDQVHMTLATGSAANLKPELVMSAFLKNEGSELDSFALSVNRDEVYADMGTEEGRKLVSLESLGEDIVL